MNYPTEEYESYADCDDHYVRSFLPPGLKPFWTVDNVSQATDIFSLDYEFAFKIYTDLGTILKDKNMVKYIIGFYFLLRGFILRVKGLRLSPALLKNGGNCGGRIHHRG